MKSYNNHLTEIWDSVFENNKFSSVSFSKSVDHIWNRAFANNQIRSIDFSQDQRYDCLGGAVVKYYTYNPLTDHEHWAPRKNGIPPEKYKSKIEEAWCWPNSIGYEAFANNSWHLSVKLPWSFQWRGPGVVNWGVWSGAFQRKDGKTSATSPSQEIDVKFLDFEKLPWMTATARKNAKWYAPTDVHVLTQEQRGYMGLF